MNINPSVLKGRSNTSLFQPSKSLLLQFMRSHFLGMQSFIVPEITNSRANHKLEQVNHT